MKQFQKIDIYFNGDYICSTTRSKNCKNAIKNYINYLLGKKHKIGGLTFLEDYILKKTNLIKAKKAV